MRLVLNVGPPKTGASDFQAVLSTNRERLRDAEWIYPKIGIPGLARDHRDLAYASERFLSRGGALRLRILSYGRLHKAGEDIADALSLGFRGTGCAGQRRVQHRDE